MKQVNSQGSDKRIISAGMRAVDIWIAILLLTGQISVGGVFVSAGAIWLSVTGPILGGVKQVGTTPDGQVVQDGVDVVTALLLILGQITNTGPWIASGRFNFVVSGPAFGNNNVPVPADPSETSESAETFFKQFRQQMILRQMSNGMSHD